MKILLKAAVAAAAFVAIPAAAQAQVATADLGAAVEQSAAMKAAQTQIQTQYKAQIDAFNARQQALAAELQPLQREIQTLQANSATPPATLQQKVTAYRTREQAAQRELAGLAAPFGRPSAYAQEQVADKVEPAVRAAMAAKNVSLLVRPEAVLLALPAGDLTADIVSQLNAQVKTVSITPPANWQPGQAKAGAAPAAATPAKPTGR
ncbi:outer membrane chaperone Skp [Sphingomonas oleivorans]|uniref:Outer membrane chaperone Skp n=1 Tax=Sphingomonas oleivorans TaxID=1735121 RepID=A0A2T5FYK9_9SPHN|nr:OmpH family outer membrane protein [Sphingomonas oleivorans]PTQ11617.1 outer membrane chaperone Skp [Sphingomonas oleivorans]